MRTTVNINDEALRLCKLKAQEQHKSLGEIISKAVVEVYRDRPMAKTPIRYNLPESGEGGLLPGVDLNCTSTLEDFMQQNSR